MLKQLLAEAALLAATGAFAQSMTPVGSGFGPNVPANPPGLEPDLTTGSCTSEIVTTFQPPAATLKAAFYFPWHLAPSEGNYWSGCVQPFKAGFLPQAALYSSTSNAVIAQHMASMKMNDVDVVGIEWTGPGPTKYEDTNSLRSGLS